MESIEKMEEAGLDQDTDISEMDKEWISYSLEKDIVNPKGGNDAVYDKLADLHSEMKEDKDVKEATAKAQSKLEELKSSLS